MSGAGAGPGRDDRADRGTASLVTGGLGGCLLLAATFLPWARHGAGSSIAARRLGDLILSGTVEAWVPRWLGVAVYVVPVAGALVLIGSGLGGRAGAAVAAAGLGPAVVVTALTVAALPRRHPFDLGTGAVLAGVGLCLGAAAAVLSARMGPRRPT